MAKELMKLNVVELRQQAIELKKKLAQLRFDKATGKVIDTAGPSRVRKELARVLTKISEISVH